jgi:tRNA A37 N6-isopentenylltransferase MiaA
MSFKRNAPVERQKPVKRPSQSYERCAANFRLILASTSTHVSRTEGEITVANTLLSLGVDVEKAALYDRNFKSEVDQNVDDTLITNVEINKDKYQEGKVGSDQCTGIKT